MRLMSPHNIRKPLLRQEVADRLVPKTNSPSAPQTISIPRLLVHASSLLLLTCRVAPNTIARHLLILILLVLIRRIDPRHLAHVENIPNPPSIRIGIRNRPRDPPVNAENILIDHRRQGHAIERLVNLIPQLKSHSLAKPLLTLINKTPRPVMLLPSVHIPRFVIPPQQKHLVRQRQLHGKQICHALETAHAPVDVISQKDEIPRRETHAQIPNVIGEEMQIFQIAVDVPENVGGTLEEDAARFVFQDGADFFVETVEVFGELVGFEVGDVIGGGGEHVGDSAEDGAGGISLEESVVGVRMARRRRRRRGAVAHAHPPDAVAPLSLQRIQHPRSGNAGISSHAAPFGLDDLPPPPAGFRGGHSHGGSVGGELPRFVLSLSMVVLNGLFFGEVGELVLKGEDLFLEGGDGGISFAEEGFGFGGGYVGDGGGGVAGAAAELVAVGAVGEEHDRGRDDRWKEEADSGLADSG
mmetsp:Transcript_30894/g.61926  ORF Transcript_30894/g.61926 Transcript_30894/m.61926 type:complete len:469 (+) Transcript_30894:213-1619(+)